MGVVLLNKEWGNTIPEEHRNYLMQVTVFSGEQTWFLYHNMDSEFAFGKFIYHSSKQLNLRLKLSRKEWKSCVVLYWLAWQRNRLCSQQLCTSNRTTSKQAFYWFSWILRDKFGSRHVDHFALALYLKYHLFVVSWVLNWLNFIIFFNLKPFLINFNDFFIKWKTCILNIKQTIAKILCAMLYCRCCPDVKTS